MPRKPPRRKQESVTCPACGSEKAKIVQRSRPLHEEDVDGTFRDEITECTECGESVYSYEQAMASSRAYAVAAARARGTLTPERLYELRLSLGWSQVQMEEAFGVGEKTWGRWERGTVPLSGPAARLVWLAENDRPAFLSMCDAQRPDRQRQTKVAGSISPQGPGEKAIAFKTANVARNASFDASAAEMDAGGSV
jgi:putative zinc finger/helix-turn-helix YgiT family protein